MVLRAPDFGLIERNSTVVLCEHENNISLLLLRHVMMSLMMSHFEKYAFLHHILVFC